jgi:hypothetical protein
VGIDLGRMGPRPVCRLEPYSHIQFSIRTASSLQSSSNDSSA